MRLAAVQMTSTEDVAANLGAAASLVRQAAEAGADLIGLPENFAYLGSDRDHRLSIAEALPALGAEALDAPGAAAPLEVPGPILGTMRDLARAVKRPLLLGGFPEKGAR